MKSYKVICNNYVIKYSVSMKELVGDLSKILKFTIRSKGFIRQESVGVIERCERAGLRAEQSIYL